MQVRRELIKYKKLSERLAEREGKLLAIERQEERVADTYDKAFDSWTDMMSKVSPLKDKDSGRYWYNNLLELRPMFRIIDELLSENTRLRGSFQNLFKEYRDMIDLNTELSAKNEKYEQNTLETLENI